MFKTGELLKGKRGRIVWLAVTTLLLVAITVIVCAAVSGKVVNIYDGDVVTNVKTSKQTVGAALEEAGIVLGEFDVTDPSLETKITANMEIRISRATMLTLSDGGETRSVSTLSKTVADLLSEQEITLLGFDTVNPAPEMEITEGMTVEVLRSKNILFTGDGVTQEISTLTNTVGEVIAAMGLTLDEDDFTKPEADTKLTEGLEVRLVRVDKKTVTQKETVGYVIEERNTSALTKGNTRIAPYGKNGVRSNTYAVVLHDGEEVTRELVSSEITKQPVTKIIEKGTAAPKKTSSVSSATFGGGTASTAKGENFTYKKLIVCTATAYDLSYESCGKYPDHPDYGITASGMKAGPGVIAVDPSVIPLGTRLYVEAVDGSWSYGYCVAGDTGSGIIGNRVDLFFHTKEEVRNFGRRQANVYVL